MRTLFGEGTRAMSLLIAAIMATAAIGHGEVSSHRVKAVLVNQESSLHTSVSNRDVYMLRVVPRSGRAFSALAIDNYPSYAEAMPLHGAPKDTTFSVKLIRTPYCDRTTSDAGSSIPCFEIERNSWRPLSRATTDAWWK
jgi:hypothetical protein